MEFTPETRKRLTRWVIGVITSCILIYLGLRNLGIVADAVVALISIFMPLIIGGVIALIINVPMGFFEKKMWPNSCNKTLVNYRRPAAYLVSLLLICGIFVGVTSLVIPELAGAIGVIGESAIAFLNRLSKMSADEIAEMPLGRYLLDVDWDKLLTTMQSWLKNQSGNIINSVIGSVSTLFGEIYNFFLSFIFSIYLLFQKEVLAAQICRLVRAWIPKTPGEWLIHCCAVLGENLRNFISGQTLEAVILGTLCMIGMWILQIPYAPMVGAMVGVTALIPVVGAFIGIFAGAFMILTVDPVKTVIFIVFLLVLQQLEGNLIYPKVMGSRVNLPAMWILAAVTVGGNVARAVGMLLAVPLASTAYILLREGTEYREQKQMEVRERQEAVLEEENIKTEVPDQEN